MKLRIFTLIVFSILLFPKYLYSCGYMEYEWEYRPLMFKALLPRMYAMQPFIYTTESVYYIMDSDPMGDDRERNIAEWQKATSSQISSEDIYNIQYATKPEDFIYAFEKSNWKKFDNNSFVKYLTQKEKNKDLLEYMLFAKQVEATEWVSSSTNFEEWDSGQSYGNNTLMDQKTQLIIVANKKLQTKLSSFLTDRYAFQLVRLNWQINQFQEAVDIYDKYFKKPDTKSLMNVWACLFKAMALDGLNRKQEANYYYIYAFDGSSEKKLRASQLFNSNLPISELLNEQEQSIAQVINAIGYPGRALDKMQKVYVLNNKSEYLCFLVMREINKLEDWLLSSVYLESASSPFACAYDYSIYNSDDDGDKLKKQNLETETQYLRRLKKFIEQVSHATNLQEEKDYYAIALAHLSLLDENADDAKKYLALISSNANNSILVQQKIEKIWLSMQTDDIASEAFKDSYAIQMNQLKKLVDSESGEGRGISAIKDFNYRVFFTLDLSLAQKYKKMNDILNFALLKNRSDIGKATINWDVDNWVSNYWNSDASYYQRMKQLDYYASTSDIDNLIILLKKTNKSDFEKYISEQHFNPIDAYKDLKGTIAFRNKDFDLAYKTFSEMDQQFWNKNYEFKYYLNEDPFIPKSLKRGERRVFTYQFNKTEFVKQILYLIEITKNTNKEKVADAYLKLGHAFYNTSYWGNSWMMTSYGQSINDKSYLKSISCFPQWRQEYLTGSIAIEYYQKAMSHAVNNEQRAYASIMLSGTFGTRSLLLNDKKDEALAIQFANKYFRNFQNTAFGKQNECFGFEQFISSNSGTKK